MAALSSPQTDFAYGGLHLGGSQAFAGHDLISNGFARTSGSSAASEPASASLFANAPPTTGAVRLQGLGLDLAACYSALMCFGDVALGRCNPLGYGNLQHDCS